MAKKTRKRGGSRSRKFASRGKSRGGKKFAKRRSSARRGSKRSRGSNRRSGHQTIRLVIEQAPQESSMEMTGRPTRKAMF